MPGVRGRRWLVILAVLVGLVGLYAAAGFSPGTAPAAGRSWCSSPPGISAGRSPSGTSASILSPGRSTSRISPFPDADGQPMVSFSRLEVAVGISSVPRLAPSLDRHRARPPPHQRGGAARAGKPLNLLDLERPFAQPARAKAPAPASKPFKLFLDRLAVENGSATYEDDSRPAPFRLDLLNPIGFELPSTSAPRAVRPGAITSRPPSARAAGWT